MKKWLRTYTEDLFIAAGVILINVATFRIGTTFGIYCAGVSFVVIGLILARQPTEKG